ncbi:hypothetical protein JMM63_12330 [Rhodovulum sulfidophilum]|uniref:hypothetical protein n=1 Tax=Rhodovulum sulfidophilum TaxID=35806 RepID=UPI001924FBB7|nr:hypothetical protein [Rhodovulum sulfidophilum]MBL3596350.1 hypothetical protein [Rhodovulum sulfidophilum]
MATFQDVQAAVKDIAARLNATPELARAALINPLLALEELGFELDLAARLELEDRARFSKKQSAERRKLRDEIFEAAGRVFDPGQGDVLAAVLFDELNLDVAGSKRPDLSPLPIQLRAEPAAKNKIVRVKASQIASRFSVKAKEKSVAKLDPGLIDRATISDPLKALTKAHSVVPPLLAYRQLDAAVPRFAPEPLYHAVRSGKRRLAGIVPRAVVTGAA